MQNLAQHRCLSHPGREAVARCPECGEFFCRECITEHDDRVICAACLRKLVRRGAGSKQGARSLAQAGLGLAGLLLASLYFYWLGQLLMLIPTDFHDGTIWRASFWNR